MCIHIPIHAHPHNICTYMHIHTTYAHTCTNAHTDSSACRGHFLYWALFIAIKKALHCEQRSSRTPFLFHKRALYIPQQIADEYENTHKFHIYIYRQHGMQRAFWIAIKRALSLAFLISVNVPYVSRHEAPHEYEIIFIWSPMSPATKTLMNTKLAKPLMNTKLAKPPMNTKIDSLRESPSWIRSCIFRNEAPHEYKIIKCIYTGSTACRGLFRSRSDKRCTCLVVPVLLYLSCCTCKRAPYRPQQRPPWICKYTHMHI